MGLAGVCGDYGGIRIDGCVLAGQKGRRQSMGDATFGTGERHLILTPIVINPEPQLIFSFPITL